MLRVSTRYVIICSDDENMHGDYISESMTIFLSHPSVGIIHNNYNPSLQDHSFYQAGNQALLASSRCAGRIAGTAYDMSKVNLFLYPLQHECIYPQLQVASSVLSRHDFFIIHSSGFVPQDTGDSTYMQKSYQGRPNDMGIFERLSYFKGKVDFKTLVLIAISLSAFCQKLHQNLARDSKVDAFKFSITAGMILTLYSPLFLVYLAKNAYFLSFFLVLLRVIIRPSLWFNYLRCSMIFLPKLF